ncbi:hypothetical protein DFH09DRAFT_1354165 [Mycena vulgaris]|nr:hypothetical protein DFH09DRAFT_1354165 [Mycena vulgaris]
MPPPAPSIASTKKRPTNDLPPLFATPSTPPELTAELYDFVALALRAFVNPWWTKISRYDKDFLPDITRILTHVIRALEARVLDADLAPLVFRDGPALITQHYRDYRTAAAKLSTSYAAAGALTLPCPLSQPPAPYGCLSRRRHRPREDYDPEPERFVIREIVLKILLKDVIPKITQPWFIQKTILELLDQDDVVLTKSRPSSPPAASTFSFHTLIVVFLSVTQALSGACLAMIHAAPRLSPVPRPRSPTSVPIPTSPISPSLSTSSSISSWAAPHDPVPPSPPPPDTTPHDYALPPLALLSEVFTTPARMASASITHTLSLLLVVFAPFLDRLLPYLLAQALSPKLLLTTTRSAKRSLFPNGYPAPPPPDPTPEEQAQMRARLLAYRGKSPWVETHILPLVLGADPSEALAVALDPLTSRECNVHLVMLLLDCVIGTLFPELLGE